MRQRVIAADRLLAPLLSFVSVYVATLILLTWIRFPLLQWTGLLCVGAATAVTIAIWERNSWPLGLFVPARLAVPELLRGALWGLLLISACAVLVVLTTDVHHERGTGFPWLSLALVFAPAVLHEELLFRGYPFQKLLQWNRPFAIFFVAFVFAALHIRNASVTELGLLNIFLGGVLLGIAYERYGRLWFPIGLHLAWNLTIGPLLGHEVSGYEDFQSVLVERGGGPDVLTGGEFGVEGSVLMTVVELAAIALLMRRISSARATFQTPQVKEPHS